MSLYAVLQNECKSLVISIHHCNSPKCKMKWKSEKRLDKVNLIYCHETRMKSMFDN